MADDKASKPKSFRIDDETADKFKEISNSIGGNQQETMSTLINAYYLQSQQNNLGEYKANIDQFQAYITSVVTMYTQSLQANHDMRDSVMQEFEALLKSKDATIHDLQEKLSVAKQLKEEATTKAKNYTDENDRLTKAIDNLNTEYHSKINDLQSMLVDKDSLNKALTDSCNDLKIKVEDMKESSNQLTTIRKELEQLRSEHNTVVKEKSDLEKQLNQEQTAHDKAIADMQQHEKDLLERVKEQSQLELDKAVLQVEKKYQEQIEKLKADKQAEIDKYQQKYFNLLESMKVNQENDITE